MRNSQEMSLEELFYQEAKFRSQNLMEQFLSSKQSGQKDPSLLRELHTLKGSARMAGLSPIAELVHSLEEMILALRWNDSTAIAQVESSILELSLLIKAGEPESKNSANRTRARSQSLELVQELLSTVSRLQASHEASFPARKRKQARWDLDFEFSRELEALRANVFNAVFGEASELFLGLDQLVQTVAQSEGKKASLQFDWSLTHLLREYIPELRAALVHLLSNCVVHGLELEEDRKQAGKAPEGELTVSLSQEGHQLSLVVCDDGRGVDLGRLKDCYTGNAAKQSWEELDDQQRLDLLFQEGTSLSQTTTVHAGRGVGLSAVQFMVNRLGGSIGFETRPCGTCLRILIPCPFYVAQCLMVESGHMTFALVSSSIASVDTLSADCQEQRVTPLALGLGFRSEDEIPERLLLKGSEGEDPIQFAVSRSLGFRTTLVYPIPDLSGMPKHITGLTDHLSGHCFVVDLSKFDPNSSVPFKPAATPSVQVKKQQILVVDDSITTRSILSDLLSRAGFQVTQAQNGEEALKVLLSSKLDGVVCDLEMPVMNGLELLEEMRKEDSSLADMPFLLFTSRDQQNVFEKALLLGADRCVGKADFKEETFLEILRQIL